MNILIISGGIPTNKDPLHGIFSYDQAVALKKQGNNVVYFAIDMRSILRKRRYGIYMDECNGIPCGHVGLPVGGFSLKLLNAIGSYCINKLYDRFFSGFKPDVIHAHFNEMGYISIALAERLNTPLIITEHSSVLNSKEIDPYRLKCIKKAYEKATAVVAVSEALSRSIKCHTGIDSIVINNMVSTDLFDVNHASSNNEFRVVHVGNLVEIKNQSMLLEAFEIFHQKHRRSRLYIVGDGNLREILENKCNQLDLGTCVSFMGRMERRDIAKLFNQCNVFAFTSISETFGVACIEALASGLPVVTTNCGGPNEFVTEDNGIIVNSNRPEDFADALEKIYLNSEKYDSEKISIEIRSKYSEKNIAEKLVKLYSELSKNV